MHQIVKLAVCLAAATSAGCATSVKPTDAIVKSAEPPAITMGKAAVGSTATITESVELEARVVRHKPEGDDTIAVTSKMTSRRTEEVVAVSDGVHAVATRVKVTYEEKTLVASEEGKPEAHASRLVGKSYVVESKEGRVLVADDEGRAVSPAEIEEVLLDYRHLGEADPVAVKASGRLLRKGENVPEVGRAIAEKLGRDGRGNVGEASARVRDKQTIDGASCLVFDVAARPTAPFFKASTLALDLRGTLALRAADAREALFELEGPATITGTETRGDGKGVPIEGKGTMRVRMVSTYR